MKNKSTRHKDANTFKFQTFSERISNIDVDIFHKVSHEYETQTEEGESHFFQTIEKWTVLNLSEGYETFKRDIRANNYITLPQVLLAKEHIIEILLNHLKKKDVLYLQPILEIIVAVAQDLQKEFYPFYQRFLEIIIDLLNTKSPDQLEWVFTCLAYLFKILWRPMIKNIHEVFNSLLPLLSDTKPEYINAFAAESFAFVARKVKDKPAFLGLLLKTVHKKQDGISGCGKLLFEVIKGVDGQFHNSAEQFLQFYFERLRQEQQFQDTLLEILEHIVSNVASNIKPQKTGLIWNVIFSNLTLIEEEFRKETEKSLEMILKLLGQMVEYKGGKLLQDSGVLIQHLVKLLSIDSLSEHTVIVVVQIAISILLSKFIRLPQEQASMLVRKILLICDKNTLLYFVDNVNSCSLFETMILPYFLKKCGSFDFDKECLYTLAKLALEKQPRSDSGINLIQWRKYILDFKESNPDILKRFSILLDLKRYEDLEDKEYFCALVCLPHLKLSDKDIDIIKGLINSNINTFLNRLSSVQDLRDIKICLFWLNVALESLIHIAGRSAITQELYSKLFDSLLPYVTNISHESALKSLSLVFSVLIENENVVNMETLLMLNKVCRDNFNSPYHELRLHTSFIYTLFENVPELKHSEPFKVFSLIYETESIEPLVHTYRDQLQRLEKLSFNKPQMIICSKTQFSQIPLRYLCGVLYMNFKLLWEPVCKILETYAHGMDSSLFWSVFGQELNDSVKNVKESKPQIDSMEISDFELLQNTFQESHATAKADFVNYRMLLWRALGLFADVAEAKTRDVAQLLLNFIENEYTSNNAELATISNIKIYDVEAETIMEKPLEIAKQGKKAMIKTLLNKLNVFSQFRNPKSMYREPELHKLYFDLLKHRNAELQRAALNCLVTYKHKYLTPYKEHLYNLIDDKNFKHEITSFRIDKDSDELLLEHRDNFVPVVLQIVFSKMSGKAGLRTGGKASGQQRRNLVLRFLAGCQENEMLSFTQKAFALYSKYIQDNELDLVKLVSQNVDLEKCLSPKKMSSTLNLLNVILDQFGGLTGEQLVTYLLKILFIIGSMIKGIFTQLDKVHAGYLALLKNIRTSSIQLLERFFEHFDKYPWTSTQINAVFDTFVWPYLEKLNMEGVYSPTNLLKLIKQWGSNPRYFKLLVKYKEDNLSYSILPFVFQLLVNPKSHISVINAIYEVIECLLKFQASAEEAELEVDNLLAIDESVLAKTHVNEKLNYGSCILLPHIPVILQRIKSKLEGKNRSLNKPELFILSRISELVWESDISDSILHLLLPLAQKKCSLEEDVITQFLISIHNLLKNVNNPENHLKMLTPLFGEVTYPSCRKLLTQSLEYISQKSSEFTTIFGLIAELNAFDSKWLDQPDFERRFEAFKQIKTLIDQDQVDLRLGTLIIYNLYFLLKNEKDLALRDGSSHCLKTLCPFLVRKFQNNPKDLDFLLNNCIFSLIKSGLKSTNNSDLRNECISLLGCLARQCPNSHFALRDLNKLTNSVDMEVDFFENLTHMQLHRHARAMTKFCQIFQQETVCPNPKTITQFLLPLATHYLCSEKFLGKNALIDAAIDMTGVICRILPWHQYEAILKYALSKLRFKLNFQKQLVRLVVTILDAFHYDLSKGHVSDVQIEAVDINDNVESNNEEVEEEVDEAVNVEDEVDEEEEESTDELKIVDKVAVLCKSTATRVIKTIQCILLPQLHKSLAEFSHLESSHKVNKKQTRFEKEEEDLSRVPISLAVVKLLQRLPKEVLDSNLPKVFLKLCTFLKSRLDSVRRVARETLQKIMLSLGPKYLGMLLSQISPLMSRGYQVHVLVFTVHGILNCLKGLYEPKDVDEVLLTVLNLCTADLFGVLSEEKEVVKITGKVSEAKSTKSYDTWQILAQHITESCLMDLILPLKQLLESNYNFKTVQKVQDVLRHVSLGLVDNKFVTVESLLKFAYGTSAQKIPQLLPAKKKKLNEDIKTKPQKEDCLIIPKVPGNRTAYRLMNVKNSSDANAHVMIEFGLRLCHVMLKRDLIKDKEFRPFLDPFVTIFRDCLKSKHVKLGTLTLQCLQWMMKYDVPSMRQNIKQIAKNTFSILHKYASAGLSKGDNFDLVVAAFKTVAVLVRDVEYYTINVNQLKVLLMYVEQDMLDYDRQASAFSLLKAIISRKLNVKEIHDVMGKVAELSVTSELSHVRAQARSVFHQFLMEYPLGDTLEKHLSFYLSQMSFEMQYGRESAIEMIHLLINTFPLNVLKDHSATLMITLGARLVNDEVPECKKLVAECLSSMFKKLPKADRDPLFKILTVWLKDKEISHRGLAAQLCGILVTIEKEDFETRLPQVLPLLLKQFGLTNKSPGKFVKVNLEKNTRELDLRLKDHHYFQVLQFMLKICSNCPAFLKRVETIEHLAYFGQSLLAYPHDWVRLGAAQFLGFVLASMDLDGLGLALLEGRCEKGYLHLDPENSVKSLALDLSDQLIPGNVKPELAEQVIKNLVFLARVLTHIPNEDKTKINLSWLAKRMRKIVNSEIITSGDNIALRTEVFKWIAGVITALDLENIRPVMHHLLAPLAREMITTDEKNAPLRQLAKEVANLLKQKAGPEEYTKSLQKLQQNLSVKRAERKRERTQLAVTDPEVYAKKKIKMHEKKKLAKKRKLEELRGKKSFKRRKVVDLENDNSECI